MKRYDIIEHTADIGMHAYGQNPKELFENAAFGMFNIIADVDGLKGSITLSIDLKANNLEELLLAWLDELLFHFYTKWLLFFEFSIEGISKNRLRAKAIGRHLGENKNRLKTEIKAVTYHELKIIKAGRNYEATVIFDV